MKVKLLQQRKARFMNALISFSLSIFILTQPAFSQEQQTWIEKSNENAQVLLNVMAKAFPESAGRWGVEGLDEEILDIKPGYLERRQKDYENALTQLKQTLETEQHQAVQQDLQIMIAATEQSLEGLALNQKYELPYFNLPQTIFNGLRGLLDDQMPAERRPAALVRLKKYTGLTDGYQPRTEFAKSHTKAAFANTNLTGPFKGEIERNLGNSDRFV